MGLDLLVWIILFSIFAGVVVVVHYWVGLFQERDQYTRNELLDFYTIIRGEIDRVIDPDEPMAGYLAIGLGVVSGWALALLGGLFSPGMHYGSGHFTNYFFQSPFFALVMHIAWPSMKELAIDRGQDNFLGRLLDSEVPYFYGLCTTLAALNLGLWGIYHEMSFLFCLPNAILLLGYAGYRLIEARSAGPRDEYYEDELPEDEDGYADFPEPEPIDLERQDY